MRPVRDCESFGRTQGERSEAAGAGCGSGARSRESLDASRPGNPVVELGELLEELDFFFEEAIDSGAKLLLPPLGDFFDMILQPVV